MSIEAVVRPDEDNPFAECWHVIVGPFHDKASADAYAAKVAAENEQ